GAWAGLACLPPGPPPPLDPEAGLAFWALGGSPEPRGGPAGGGWAVVAAASQPRVFPRPGPRPRAVLLELGADGPLPPVPLDVADVRLASVEVHLGQADTIGRLEELAWAGLGQAAEDPRPVVAQLVVVGDGPGRRHLGDPAARSWLLD